MKIRLTCFLLLAAAVLFLDSCKKDRATSWNTELLVPIASSSLSIQNIVKDSTIRANADSSLILAFNSTLYEFNLADQIINIPDTNIGQKFNLSTLQLPNQRVTQRISLGTLATNMAASPDPGAQLLGNLILSQSGQNSAIPALNNIAPGAFPFDASAYFDSAILASGQVQIWAVNNLPVPLDNVTVELRNHDDNSLVASKFLQHISAHDSIYAEVDLAGAKLKKDLDFRIASMSTPGTSGALVLIDTTDYIELRLFVISLRASEAWARFPSQDVVNITEEVTQDIEGRKFTYVDAREGQLLVTVTSSVQEQLQLEYTLEGAYDRNGNPLVEYTTVPAAAQGVPTTVSKLIDISGCAINLTGKDGSKFNTYTQHVVAHIDSSGIVRHITQADSIIVRYDIKNVAPNYIKGYAGRDTLSAQDSSDFAFLDIFKSGSIDLESVNMNFVVENGLGVDGVVKINSLTAISQNNGSRTLTGSIIGQPLVVNRATDFPLTKGISTLAVNSNNSNIKDLIGILPNKLLYDVDVHTNIAGNNNQYRDFAYLESGMKVGLNAEIPLSFIANHLVLRDTIQFDLSTTNTNIEGISDGLINVITQNKYPLDATLTMVIVDSNWVGVDTLLMNTVVEGADLNNNCRAETSKRSKIPLYVDEARMENVKRGKHAIIVADFNSNGHNAICNGQYLKIYSDYKLDITFTARFNYKVNAKF